MKKLLILLIFPVLALGSTFEEKYHGTFRGEFSNSWFGAKKECTLNISFSHFDHLGSVEIKYHKFDIDFGQGLINIDGEDFDMDEIDNKLSENWFMMDYPHKNFGFSQHYRGTSYLVTYLKFDKEQNLKKFQLYTKDARTTLGSILGPLPMQGITCKNLKKIN